LPRSGQIPLKRPFDHIISNPPFFINSLKSPDTGRNTARHNDGLPLHTLIELSSLLLKDSGKLSIVFPYTESHLLINVAVIYSLNLSRQLIIIPKLRKEPNRILLEFTKGPVVRLESSELAIRDSHGKYTPDYVELTERFYLHLKG
jgi:tRNA1Val (adenine37-N6)-methyltransferase